MPGVRALVRRGVRVTIPAVGVLLAAVAATVASAAGSERSSINVSLSSGLSATAQGRGNAGRSPTSASLDPLALAQARNIRRDVSARNVRSRAGKLVVTEASSTGVLESFTLLTAGLDEARTLPAGNGIYFALCPRGATCPYPARRFARPASDFLPRHQALELALRTFLETSAALVAVSLPTSRFIFFIVEREELAREADLPSLARALRGDPAQAPASLRRLVDRITGPRVFVALGIERGPAGGETLTGMPLWRDRVAG